jgi:hypothetical protein
VLNSYCISQIRIYENDSFPMARAMMGSITLHRSEFGLRATARFMGKAGPVKCNPDAFMAVICQNYAVFV